VCGRTEVSSVLNHSGRIDVNLQELGDSADCVHDMHRWRFGFADIEMVKELYEIDNVDIARAEHWSICP